MLGNKLLIRTAIDEQLREECLNLLCSIINSKNMMKMKKSEKDRGREEEELEKNENNKWEGKEEGDEEEL